MSVVKIQSLSNGIKNVVLSRPTKLNSLNMDMFESIAGAAQQLRQDPSVRAVILSGEGRAFCTGLDVKGVMLNWNGMRNVRRLLERPSGYERQGGEAGDFSSDGDENSNAPETDAEVAGALGNLAQDVAFLWRDLPVPVIAALQGMCFGGGMQIALGADMRFATPDCKLSIMESKWGLIPDMGASIFLRELVRIDIAKELTMTGRIIKGEEAANLGLITRCVDNPLAEAIRVAEEIVARSPDTSAAAKKLYQNTWVADEQTCLNEETRLQRKLIGSYNQMAASGRNFGGPKLPYAKLKSNL